MTAETIVYDEAYIREFSKERNEPEWLLELRIRGLKLSNELAMPKPDKTKIDNWNYTSFEHQVAAEAVGTLQELPQEVKELLDEEQPEGNIIVQRNATVAFKQLSEELKNKGVIFTDLRTAFQEHSELVKKYFMTEAVKIDKHRLTAMHAALLNGGTFLYVPKNVEIEVPLQAVYWQEDPASGLFNHVLIVAEDNSSVTYVENYLSTGSGKESVATIIAEVFAGPNALIRYGAVDNLGSSVTSYINRTGMVSKDGRIEWALGQMNDGNTVSENWTECIGDGSSADAKMVTIGRGKQIQNFLVRVDQIGKHSDGQIFAHGVMKDSATGVFNGIGKIHHGGTKSNAEQTSRILMLSEKARGDANPILLIDEDDVTAGHAASVGRVDDLQLYYLMSRGIDRLEAQRLIVHGFLEPVVATLPIEGVKQALVGLIERKIQ
ncbi:Fe-S cluster assembly protein SufD [Pueribacillus theae]|uniref:Fe-S cluster assembly protein SufD n=1 Tax=Pueribacillus theae TaxID=2171751 RepID=A0A2U1K498_9BACI|nr:Fe-S cluster assembly protein SufD [Pueribacillus theae]PWA12014.1 Fe-S cluster assembly protein SufD [Pueribacillus theae]